MHKEHHGFLFGLLASVSAAVMAVLIKFAAAVPNEALVFFRFVIPLPFILWLVGHKKIELSWKKLPGHLVRSLAGLMSMYCYFYAIKALPMVNALTLSNTSPLFMPLVVLVWLKLIVSKLRFVAVGIGFVGVMVLLHPTNFVFGLGSLAGLATGLLSAVVYMTIRQLSKEESPETILAYYFLIASLITFFPMISAWEPIAGSNWIYIFGLGIFSFIYQYAMTRSFTLAAATKMSTMTYLTVVFGGLAGWWIFGETPDYWVLVGAALIIGSALLALFDKTPPRPIGEPR